MFERFEFVVLLVLSVIQNLNLSKIKMLNEIFIPVVVAQYSAPTGFAFLVIFRWCCIST